MSREQMLLDRIALMGAAGGSGRAPSAMEDVDVLMESVRRNLARLLNARHGMSQALPDYGLPALTDLTIGSRDYVEQVQEAIRTAIEHYEPRLRAVRVLRSGDEEGGRQKLGFRVEATLVSRTGEHRVWYETMVKGSGQFEVLD